MACNADHISQMQMMYLSLRRIVSAHICCLIINDNSKLADIVIVDANRTKRHDWCSRQSKRRDWCIFKFTELTIDDSGDREGGGHGDDDYCGDNEYEYDDKSY